MLLILVLFTALQSACLRPDPPPHSPAHAAGGSAKSELAGTLRLINAPLPLALDVYRGLYGSRLTVPPELRKSRLRITLGPRRSLTRAEAARLLERAFQEQAGLRIMQSKDNTLTVTLGPASE